MSETIERVNACLAACEGVEEPRAGELKELREQRKELVAAATAFCDLGACYRLGSRPGERLFRQLDKAHAALARAKGGEG